MADIVIDFDGTCTTHDYPYIGYDVGAVPVLKRLVKNGHRLILFTMRSRIKNDTLVEAIEWFKKNDIALYGIQTHPEQKEWSDSPKAYGQMYIDDAALGCPLKWDRELSRRLFADWAVIEKMLEDKGFFNNEKPANTIEI